MKLTRKQKDRIGLGALISAVVLTVTFITLSFRKRSILAALAAMAMASGAVGGLLLTDSDAQSRAKHGEEELFDEAECREADARVRQSLRGKRGGEGARNVLKEILCDEECEEISEDEDALAEETAEEIAE